MGIIKTQVGPDNPFPLLGPVSLLAFDIQEDSVTGNEPIQVEVRRSNGVPVVSQLANAHGAAHDDEHPSSWLWCTQPGDIPIRVESGETITLSASRDVHLWLAV